MLDDDGAEPLGRGVDRGGEAGRATTDDAEVVEVALGAGAQSEGRRDRHRRRGAQRLAVGDEHEREVLGLRAGEVAQPGALRVALDVEPDVRDVVVGEERLDEVAGLGPPVPHDADVVRLLGVGVVPVGEQVVGHRVEPVLRRVPRLEEVVVEPDVVDRRDRDVGVGVGREEQQLRVRHVGAYAREQLDAGHPGHALVGGDERQRLAAEDEPGHEVERLGTGRGTQDAVVGAVAGPQVPRDRGRDRRVVVHGDDRRSRHSLSVRARPGSGAGRRGSRRRGGRGRGSAPRRGVAPVTGRPRGPPSCPGRARR